MSGNGDNTNGTNSNYHHGRILVVDDEELIQTLLKEILTEEGYEVTCASNGDEAIELLEKSRFELIITDIVMPGRSGVDVLRAAKRIDPSYPVIFITGFPSVDTVVKLVNLGAADYITKPFDTDLIKVTVAKVLEMKRLGAWSGQARAMPAEKPRDSDDLTGVLTFEVFMRLLETEVGRSQLRRHVCTLMVVGVDDIEKYSGNHGQGAGDQLLKSLTRTLQDHIRPGDLVGRTDRAEFSVLLPETSRAGAEAIGRKVIRSAEWVCKVSIGIASFPRDAQTAQELLRKARMALRAARARGGNLILMPR